MSAMNLNPFVPIVTDRAHFDQIKRMGGLHGGDPAGVWKAVKGWGIPRAKGLPKLMKNEEGSFLTSPAASAAALTQFRASVSRDRSGGEPFDQEAMVALLREEALLAANSCRTPTSRKRHQD
jgi:hypothetical protein